MKNQVKPNTTTIKVLEQDFKRLAVYKIHPRQPYWEVIKGILDGKIQIGDKNVKDKNKV